MKNSNIYIAILFVGLFVSCASTKPTTANIDKIMLKQDVNKDGKISKAEADGYIAKNFAWIDQNQDALINMVELRAAAKLTKSRSAVRAARAAVIVPGRRATVGRGRAKFSAPRPGNIDGGRNRRGRF